MLPLKLSGIFLAKVYFLCQKYKKVLVLLKLDGVFFSKVYFLGQKYMKFLVPLKFFAKVCFLYQKYYVYGIFSAFKIEWYFLCKSMFSASKVIDIYSVPTVTVV